MATRVIRKKGYGIFLVDVSGLSEDARNQAMNLQKRLKRCGVDLAIWQNLTTTEMLLKTEELCSLPDIDSCDSIWLIIDSHGSWMEHPSSKEDLIYGTANKEDSQFATASSFCKILSRLSKSGKPVVMIFQSCRGEDLPQTIAITTDTSTQRVTAAKDITQTHPQNARTIYTSASGNLIPDRVPVYINQILLWSTTPGNETYPGLFNAIIEVLDEEGNRSTDIESIWTKVIAKRATGFAYQRQFTPVYYSMLWKDLLIASVVDS